MQRDQMVATLNALAAKRFRLRQEGSDTHDTSLNRARRAWHPGVNFLKPV